MWPLEKQLKQQFIKILKQSYIYIPKLLNLIIKFRIVFTFRTQYNIWMSSKLIKSDLLEESYQCQLDEWHHLNEASTKIKHILSNFSFWNQPDQTQKQSSKLLKKKSQKYKSVTKIPQIKTRKKFSEIKMQQKRPIETSFQNDPEPSEEKKVEVRKKTEQKEKKAVHCSMSYLKQKLERKEECVQKVYSKKYIRLSTLKDRNIPSKDFKNPFQRYFENKEEIKCAIRRKPSKLKSVGSQIQIKFRESSELGFYKKVVNYK